MKKIVIISAVILLLISGVYAMDLMEDEALSEINAQAGMTLTPYISAMSMSFRLEGLSWGDDDGNTATGLGGTGAGHFALRGATIAGAQDATTFTMTIPSTGPVKYDVDATGIYLTLPSFNVAMITPPRIQVSVSGGAADNFNGTVQTDTTKVLGDLALDNMTITITMPGIFRYAPH